MDVTYALRVLLRQPVFTFSAVATLALGIGVNSTIFTFANAAFFRQMPGIAEASTLVWLSAVWQNEGREVGMSYPEYLDYRQTTESAFTELIAFHDTPLSLGTGGEPQRVRGQLVTGTYFAALGVVPAAGRLIGPADDRPGTPPSVVISFRLWRQRFAGSPDILASPITINGRAFAVIGVSAEGFFGPALGKTADVWLPLSHLPEIRFTDRDLLTQRASSWLAVMGRLRPDVSIEAAQSLAAAVSLRLAAAYPESNDGRSVRLSRARSGLAPDSRGELVPLSVLLMTVTGVVLLIACANVANLLLARGAGRAGEMTVRAALGASRSRLVRQLLVESGVLAVAGAAGGLLLSFWTADIIQAQLPESEFQGLSASADARVLLFAAVLAALSVCAFGLAPALAVTRGPLVPGLRQTAAGGGRSRLQGGFVVAQLALSLVLLLAGAMSLRAVQKSGRVDLGFDPSGVLVASYDLELQNYTLERRVAFRRMLRDRLLALPGVVEAGVANMAPLSGTMVRTVVSAKQDSGADAETPTYLNAVGPGFFEALRLPVVRGRAFSERDTLGGVAAAVVNETLARNLWGDRSPVGRQVTLGKATLQVIGVARDSKYDEIAEDPRPFMYLSIDQHAQLDRETVLFRGATVAAAPLASVRAIIRDIDPALPIFDVQPLSAVLQSRLDKQRVVSVMLAGFGGVALLLASLGLYGVMAYAVTRRLREMGIRIALGASPQQLTGLIARDGLRLSLLGVAIGAALSVPVAFGLGALLFGVQIADLAAFVGTCVFLVAVGMVAALVPARRAARLDPVIALRTD